MCRTFPQLAPRPALGAHGFLRLVAGGRMAEEIKQKQLAAGARGAAGSVGGEPSTALAPFLGTERPQTRMLEVRLADGGIGIPVVPQEGMPPIIDRPYQGRVAPTPLIDDKEMMPQSAVAMVAGGGPAAPPPQGVPGPQGIPGAFAPTLIEGDDAESAWELLTAGQARRR